jgi:hypothetical protein
MKNNRITKWAASLIVMAGIAATPLSSRAQTNLFVDGSAHAPEDGAV